MKNLALYPTPPYRECFAAQVGALGMAGQSRLQCLFLGVVKGSLQDRPALALEALDHGKCEEAVPELRVLHRLLVEPRGRVGDDVGVVRCIAEPLIVNHVRTCGVAFNLTGEQIVWLKQQGVSDHVISEMQAMKVKIRVLMVSLL